MNGSLKSDFGIIITCSKHDFLFAKGTCASIRTFMPGVKICLLVDGEFDLGNLPEIFDAKVVRRSDVKNDFLRNNSFGWGLTKMIAFWESPFENFLLIDADTIVYGDVSKFADFEKYDVILDVPQYEYSEKDICKYYFDVDKIGGYYPNFSYKSRPFVCTGVIFAKRNILDLNEYEKFFKVKAADGDFYKCGEQGFLNICLFQAKDNSKLKLGSHYFQFLIQDNSMELAKAKFPIPVLNPEHPMVVHWAGKDKPLVSNGNFQYVEPMTYFRRAYLALEGITDKAYQDDILSKEDQSRRKHVAGNPLINALKKFVRSLGW